MTAAGRWSPAGLAEILSHDDRLVKRAMLLVRYDKDIRSDLPRLGSQVKRDFAATSPFGFFLTSHRPLRRIDASCGMTFSRGTISPTARPFSLSAPVGQTWTHFPHDVQDGDCPQG